MRFVCERDSVYKCMPLIKLLKEGKILIYCTSQKNSLLQLFRWYRMEDCQYMICMKQLGFSMRKMIFPSVIDTSDRRKNPSFPKGRFRQYDFCF